MTPLRYFIFKGKQIKEEEVERVESQLTGWARVTVAKRAQVILVLGGDSAMLKAISTYYALHVPFYGLNYGTVGFLLNQSDPAVIQELTDDNVRLVPIKLLRADAYDQNGQLVGTYMAVNDVVIERSSAQTARVNVQLNGEEYWRKLRCDGVLLCSPVGSTAYNLQNGGPILPITANTNILSPISGSDATLCIIACEDRVTISAEVDKYRPVRCSIDGRRVKGVVKVVVETSPVTVHLGFAASQDLHKRVQRLQFNQKQLQ